MRIKMSEKFKKLAEQKKPFANLFFSCILSFLLFSSSISYALPQDPTIQAGDVNIQQPTDNQLNIIQGSDKAIIDWRAFSIQNNESVNFKLPSSNGVTLNRVTGNEPSKILGQLTSNGKLFLINPNGILFGANSRVDVNGLVATTTDIKNEDFLKGAYNFNLPSNSTSRYVINKGDITVAEGGLVALVSPGVSNSGVINARLGKVSLVSGNTFTLDLYGDQLINLGVDWTLIEKATGVNGEKLDAMVSNSGKIYADGGIVTLKVGMAQNALDQIINMDGVIQAKAFSTNNGGTIILDGGNQGTVNVSGQLDASGKWMGQKGGVVRVSGKNVELRNWAQVDVSAHSGQGSAYIGGDAKGNAQNSYRTLLKKGSVVNADRISEWGNSGKIVVAGGSYIETNGTLSAKGGTIDIKPFKATPQKTMKMPPVKKMMRPKKEMKVPPAKNMKMKTMNKMVMLKPVVKKTEPKRTMKPKPQSQSKIKTESKPKTKTKVKTKTKPEPKSSAPETSSFIRNTSTPTVGIGGVVLAQNFNTRPGRTGIGGVDFGNSIKTQKTGGRSFNGLGGVSTTSSSNSSPVSSLRSETFTPPGQANRQNQDQENSNSSTQSRNNGLGGVSTTSSSNSSPVSSLRSETFTPPGQTNDVSLQVETNSDFDNENETFQTRSAINNARSQRLRNL